MDRLTGRGRGCLDCGKPVSFYAQRCHGCKYKDGRVPNRGKPMSAEQRAKLSVAKTGVAMPERRGSGHPMWKGDAVQRPQAAGHRRAQTQYPDRQPCFACDSEQTERHHLDGNQLNNASSNVVFLCRRHHRRIHPGRGHEPLRPLSHLELPDSQQKRRAR